MCIKCTYKRFAVTAVLAVMLGLLYCLIFGFSGQDAEQSGSLSRLVSGKCVTMLNSLAGEPWSPDAVDRMAEAFEHPLRKLAHFGEYACMGILVYALLCQWVENRRMRYLLTGGWVFLSAAGDELHQYFVPGRYASFLDVLLDTSGGVCGMLFCVLAVKLGIRRAENRGRDIHGGKAIPKKKRNSIKKEAIPSEEV